MTLPQLWRAYYMSFEREVYLAHQDGKIDDSLVRFFLPGGSIRTVEGPMWDYKTGYCDPKCDLLEEAPFLSELLRDVGALYNAFGGYLIFAYKDDQENIFKKVLNKDDFDKQSDRYFKSYIPITTHLQKLVFEGIERNILIIHVDKRASDRPPIAFKRNSAEKRGGGLFFRTDDIPLRYGSSTSIVNQRHDLLVFAFGERKPDIWEIPTRLNEIDNNLPPRDPNLIEFIGRREYLINLWNWLADLRNPVKILTALGGTGKTAIAYEFCEQIVKCRTKAFDKVIWLTAKSQTYAAILQQYVSTTRTDFTDVDSFLVAFLKEIGCLEADFSDFQNLDEKLDFAKEIIKDIPILVVIDDLDSLDQDKQIELYSRISQLFDQSLSRHNPSRVLFTSRLEPNAGANRIVKVAGFSLDEMAPYVESILRHLVGSDSWGADIRNNIALLHDASKGSPIFVASIIRLVSFGESLKSVIQNWRDKDGEEVRRFAFQREIGGLNYSDWRVLYVLQLLSATTFEEIRDILNEDRPRLQASLLRLSQFHMFAGDANPATGAQISVPEPIRLMINITEDSLRRDDAEDLKKRCARITRQADGQSEVGRLIRGITLLWKRQNHGDALKEAQRAVRELPKNGDLSCFLGRTLLMQSPPDFEAADDAFADAQHKKCERPELTEYWALVKLKRGDIEGLLRITDKANHGNHISGISLLYRLAGLYRIARTNEDRNDFARATDSYHLIIKETVVSLGSKNTDPVTADIRRLAMEVSNYLIEVAEKNYGRRRFGTEKIFDLFVECTQAGFPPTRYFRRILNNTVADINQSLYRNERWRNQINLRLREVAQMRNGVIREFGRDNEFIDVLDRAEYQLRQL